MILLQWAIFAVLWLLLSELFKIKKNIEELRVPIFDLKCKNKECGLIVENKLINPEKQLPYCPACGYETERLVSAGVCINRKKGDIDK